LYFADLARNFTGTAYVDSAGQPKTKNVFEAKKKKEIGDLLVP
jgi:hypothetical protein